MSECKKNKTVFKACKLPKPPLKEWLERELITEKQFKILKRAVKDGFSVHWHYEHGLTITIKF